MFEVLAMAFTLVGLPVALWALRLTFKQARDSKTAALAAKEAADSAIGRTLEMRLQTVVGQLDSLAQLLEAAQFSNNHQLATTALALWDTEAARLIGALRDTDLITHELHDVVRESRVEANVARTGLLRATRPVTTATVEMRRCMQAVTVQAGEIAAARLSDAGGPTIGAST